MFKPKNEESKISGKEVNVFGHNLFLRSLTLGTLKKLEPRLFMLNGVVGSKTPLGDMTDVITDVIELLVQRDYVFDRQEFEDSVDIEEVHLALPILLESCGLAQKKTD
jgi:hypothetical protein